MKIMETYLKCEGCGKHLETNGEKEIRCQDCGSVTRIAPENFTELLINSRKSLRVINKLTSATFLSTVIIIFIVTIVYTKLQTKLYSTTSSVIFSIEKQESSVSNIESEVNIDSDSNLLPADFDLSMISSHIKNKIMKNPEFLKRIINTLYLVEKNAAEIEIADICGKLLQRIEVYVDNITGNNNNLIPENADKNSIFIKSEFKLNSSEPAKALKIINQIVHIIESDSIIVSNALLKSYSEYFKNNEYLFKQKYEFYKQEIEKILIDSKLSKEIKNIQIDAIKPAMTENYLKMLVFQRKSKSIPMKISMNFREGSLPSRPFYPNERQSIIAGFIISIILGLSFAAIVSKI